MSEAEFIAFVADRLAADGTCLRREVVGGLDCLVGYRSYVHRASLLRQFTVVACAPSVDGALLESFSMAALDYGVARKGRLRGFQTGVAVVAVLASNEIEDSAVQLAKTKLHRRFAAFAWPVVFDLDAGAYYRHEGSPFVGVLYNSWMRRRIDAVLTGTRASD